MRTLIAYCESRDGAEESQLNKEMLRAAVQSIEDLSPALKFVTLITGTKVSFMTPSFQSK